MSGEPRLEVLAPDGVPEVAAGDDLVGLLTGAVSLRDGDVAVVTSKVVSKAEGMLRAVADGDRDTVLDEETVRVVARRGPTRIVRTPHGLTMAAAGIDASNVGPGRLALLPRDPDASARTLRTGLHERTGANVGVVVTDTAGRAWRDGQVDIAIGAAGVLVAEDFAGRLDPHGQELVVTRPAVADEIASAAELATGKLGGRPFAVLRGRPDLVLPPGEHGIGARALVRPEAEDLFGYGAREAVVRALAGDPADLAGFGAAAGVDELTESLVRVLPPEAYASVASMTHDDSDEVQLRLPTGTDRTVVAAVCFAHGWRMTAWDAGPDSTTATICPHTPPAGP